MRASWRDGRRLRLLAARTAGGSRLDGRLRLGIAARRGRPRAVAAVLADAAREAMRVAAAPVATDDVSRRPVAVLRERRRVGRRGLAGAVAELARAPRRVVAVWSGGAGDRALLAPAVVAWSVAGGADQRGYGARGDVAGALHGGHPRQPFVVVVAGGGGDQPRGDLPAVQEDRPEEDRLQREGEQEPQRRRRRRQGGGDGDDDRDHQRVQRLDEDGGRELAEPVAKEVMAGAREDPDHQRDRREPQEDERDDLREDHREGEESEQHDGAERADEEHRRERQALVGAVLRWMSTAGESDLSTR